MLRTFAEHGFRFVQDMGGLWEFVTADDRKAAKGDSGKGLPKAYTRTILVPSAWESQPGLEDYRGKAWYRAWVEGVEGMALRLVFGGVSHSATVYVDGKEVGAHYDAFTPFDVVVPGLGDGEHELVVEVDNSFGDHSALHIENDYYTYGGLTRPAELQYVPEVYIERLHATPVRKGKRWHLDLAVRLRNLGKADAERHVVANLDEYEADLGEVAVPARGCVELRGTLKGLEVDPWSAANPRLYFVDAELIEDGEIVDDLIDRVGFREVAVRGKKLLLNGESLRLRGYNRHEDHPQFGNALPVSAMIHDLELMLDLGCNFVRTSHYPNDHRFLDLCDELGVYVWEESHARAIDFKHPRFREQIETSTREMVDWHRNRPCIVMWGCLNECDSVSPEGRKEYERVLGLIKDMDASRPVTFASNRMHKDVCLDLVDIVSWNLYSGWYGGGVESVEPNLKKLLKWQHSPASKGGKGKPVIVSEFGAGGLYGCRNPSAPKWSEEYQAACLDETLRVYLNHADIVGAAIWQFCDVRITKNWQWVMGRPRTMNNKGTVDEYRRPKMAYETVKRRMLEARKKYDK